MTVDRLTPNLSQSEAYRKEKHQAELLKRLYSEDRLGYVVNVNIIDDRTATIDLDVGSMDANKKEGVVVYRKQINFNGNGVGFSVGDFVSITVHEEDRSISVLNLFPASNFKGKLTPRVLSYFPCDQHTLLTEKDPDTIRLHGK